MAKRPQALLFMLTMIIAGFTAGICIGGSDPGPDKLILDGGKSGDVPFPHLRHQQSLEDCTVCHNIFPQKRGAIDALKLRGDLKKKQVMNKQCIKCHREIKKTGKKAGPTSCRTCHIK